MAEILDSGPHGTSDAGRRREGSGPAGAAVLEDLDVAPSGPRGGRRAGRRLSPARAGAAGLAAGLIFGAGSGIAAVAALRRSAADEAARSAVALELIWAPGGQGQTVSAPSGASHPSLLGAVGQSVTVEVGLYLVNAAPTTVRVESMSASGTGWEFRSPEVPITLAPHESALLRFEGSVDCRPAVALPDRVPVTMSASATTHRSSVRAVVRVVPVSEGLDAVLAGACTSGGSFWSGERTP